MEQYGTVILCYSPLVELVTWDRNQHCTGKISYSWSRTEDYLIIPIEISPSHKRDCFLGIGFSLQDPITHSEKWISAKDLGISGDLETEWEQYCRDLNEAGVSLREKEDTLIWTGGDSTGRMLVKNIYSTLISIYEWPQTKRWKFKLWKWEIQLKKKLFIWLASENKILTWKVLQGKGW